MNIRDYVILMMNKIILHKLFVFLIEIVKWLHSLTNTAVPIR